MQTKFDGLMVRLASEETIEEWSHGCVEHADTINYRTWKPKPKWLFCESIFGPEKNYECSCGKYKWVRYKWIVCERCWVEVTNSRVRRERMWHIDLASPVIHDWYLKNISWWIHHLLQMSWNEVQKILSFVKYVLVDDVDEESINKILESITKIHNETLKELEDLYNQEKEEYIKQKQSKAVLDDLERRYLDNKKQIEHDYLKLKSMVSEFRKWYTILESDYRNIFQKYSNMLNFKSWPEAIYYLLKNYNVKKEIKIQLEKFKKIKSNEQKKKAFMLIKLLINLYISGVHPKNMVIRKLPVVPPALRPVVQLDWWKFASSDVNLFYRRVLMRNIRLKKMIQAWMPDVVKKNEIRLLQEAVNNLFVWEKHNSAWWWAWNKLFKSISDMLSGKEWIFRKNLLWKRVDYSWRSVITVWPDLKLNECGVPLYIAMKIFTPFVIWKLIEKNIVYTPKQAEKIIKEESPLALKLLEEVIKDKYVLLNRAPTLHRLSIEAFKIKLMPWKTIRLHPLVCPSFNADFDWDQMAIHLPISDEAQREARELIAADKNILKPASWEPTIAHSQDMVLWVYYITEDKSIKDQNVKWYFSSFEDVLNSYNLWNLNVKDWIIVNTKDGEIKTMVWRVLFNSVLPEDYEFVNETVGKSKLKKLLSEIFDKYWQETVVKVADDIKDLWFKFSGISSLTINVLDMKSPTKLSQYIKKWDDKSNKIYTLFYKGFLSEEEKHRLIVEVWTDVKNEVEKAVKESLLPWDDIFTMVDSWARWSYWNTTQITWMKWLVLNPKWEIIELPIKWNYLDWLSAVEYFISIHASRKWKADTALKTAESWYLTRKLCDACQEVFIREEDCGTNKYVLISRNEIESKWEKFEAELLWRVIAEDIYDDSDTLVIKKDTLLWIEEVKLIWELHKDFVKVRSPLTCMCERWVCQKCYWSDLATRKLVELWTPVWIIAAQSIWEPATQLTMRTFHDWWAVASKWEDMTQWLERVKQLFEVRTPKNPAVIAPFDWTMVVLEEWKRKYLILESEYQKKYYFVKDGYSVVVKENDFLKKWWVYAQKWRSKLMVKEEWVVLEVKDDSIVLWVKEVKKIALTWISPLKKNWWQIFKWEILTTWAVDVKEYMNLVGALPAQKYIIDWINAVYASQWQKINSKHIEVVVKQIFSKVAIIDAWDSTFIPWTRVKYEEFEKVNAQLIKEWKRPALWQRLVLWLTLIAKETDSWLSAASFQETIRVMVDASLRWAIDHLDDLKSNVIIWRLLPLWEEYRKKLRQERGEELEDNDDEE